MIKIFISNHYDIYTNVAIERYLFSHAENDLILFLWSNTPCVVFGRNQNVYREVDINYANKNNIKLCRRFSGGGSVYQDLGNLNYTFIAKDEDDIEKLNKVLVKVFKNIGLDVNFSGRNDLLIKDKKFSGIAYCHDFDHLMYHGTCLIDTNTDELVNVLKPHDYKLKSHSIASYHSRVINLKEVDNKINNDVVINSFIQTLKQYGQVEIIKDMIINDEINQIITYLTNKNYIYEDCPSYSYELDVKLNNSNYHFLLKYQDGVISDVKIFTDDLNTSQKDFYYSSLINKTINFNQVKEYLINL